jgi:hypothetical protein
MSNQPDEDTYQAFLSELNERDLALVDKISPTITNILDVSALVDIPHNVTAKRLAVTMISAFRSAQITKH